MAELINELRSSPMWADATSEITVLETGDKHYHEYECPDVRRAHEQRISRFKAIHGNWAKCCSSFSAETLDFSFTDASLLRPVMNVYTELQEGIASSWTLSTLDTHILWSSQRKAHPLIRTAVNELRAEGYRRLDRWAATDPALSFLEVCAMFAWDPMVIGHYLDLAFKQPRVEEVPTSLDEFLEKMVSNSALHDAFRKRFSNYQAPQGVFLLLAGQNERERNLAKIPIVSDALQRFYHKNGAYKIPARLGSLLTYKGVKAELKEDDTDDIIETACVLHKDSQGGLDLNAALEAARALEVS